MRTALIIGAGGQDGRLLARFLLARDYNVRGWTRADPGTDTACDCEVVDVLQRGTVEHNLLTLRPDEVYYLAAFHHSTEETVSECTAELLRRSFDVHVLGLLNVLQTIERSRKGRLFYAASSHVFGMPITEWQNEQTAFVPNSAYGISKAAGIQCCQLFRRERGVFAASGILFNHESALRKPSFLSQKIVRGALRARRHPAFKLDLGDIEARVDWGYAPDYVDAMFRILQLAEASDFVVASGEVHTVREFAEIAFDAVGLDWRRHVQLDPRLLKRAAHPFRGALSPSVRAFARPANRLGVSGSGAGLLAGLGNSQNHASLAGQRGRVRHRLLWRGAGETTGG